MTADIRKLSERLLESWREHLTSVRDNAEDVEGLELFIDIVELELPGISFEDYDDHELCSALRLIVELNSLMLLGLEQSEHSIVLDAHSDAMMGLANLMRSRGFHCTLPKVILR
ncbi:hypothetical protein [Amycolatopsis japonica]